MTDNPRRFTRLFTVLSLALILAAPVLAAPSEGGGDNIFAGDVGNILWTLVIFGLVLFVLGKFAWGPMVAMLQEREDRVYNWMAEAKSKHDEAASRLAKYEDILAEARAEATAIVDEGRRDADQTRIRVETEAAEEAERRLERAKREIKIAEETAIKNLYDTSASLATRIAGDIVSRELTADDHERLIREAIADLESRGDAGSRVN
ncbi:MAG: F0F1 ATP synthase subunit B [Acidobacteriota bacterium]